MYLIAIIYLSLSLAMLYYLTILLLYYSFQHLILLIGLLMFFLVSLHTLGRLLDCKHLTDSLMLQMVNKHHLQVNHNFVLYYLLKFQVKTTKICVFSLKNIYLYFLFFKAIIYPPSRCQMFFNIF